MISLLGYIFYETGVSLYFLLVRLLAPFNKKASLFTEGRRNLLPKIREKLKGDHRERIWFHCASLGEFEQARPVLEALKETNPEAAFVVTFFSPSGYEVRKNYAKADYVFYLPNDGRKNARAFLDAVKPSLVIFAKYEFWYHYLNILKESLIPTYLISANFRRDQVFFRWYGRFFLDMLTCFTRIFTQNQVSAQLLLDAGMNDVVIAGDTRFDRVWQTRSNHTTLPQVEVFKGNHLLLVAGSSYDAEEQIIAATMAQLSVPLKVIIAPHHIDEARIKRIEQHFEAFRTMRYSRFTEEEATQAQVLIIDNIGLLSSVYAYGDMAFVGGGFGRSGLHNILEPATFGMPVFFGPGNHDKFPESTQLIRARGGFVITTREDFLERMNELCINTSLRKTVGEQAYSFIESHTGATRIILSSI